MEDTFSVDKLLRKASLMHVELTFKEPQFDPCF